MKWPKLSFNHFGRCCGVGARRTFFRWFGCTIVVVQFKVWWWRWLVWLACALIHCSHPSSTFFLVICCEQYGVTFFGSAEEMLPTFEFCKYRANKNPYHTRVEFGLSSVFDFFFNFVTYYLYLQFIMDVKIRFRFIKFNIETF